MATIVAAFGVLAAMPASATIINVQNNVYGAFDSASGTRNVTIAPADVAPGAGIISDVNITIDFSKCGDSAIGPAGTACTGGGAGFSSEIVFRLTSPGGTTVNLVNEGTYFSIGLEPEDRVTVTFDDAAAKVVGGGRPLDGVFRPVGSLADFNGESAIGIWSLFIRDTSEFDPLEFFGYTLTVTTDAVSEVPEPGTLALLGAGLLGLAALPRRKTRP